MQSLGIPQGKSDHLFHVVDWLPTLADIGGVSPNGKPLDGVSQFDALVESREARNSTFLGYSATPPYHSTKNSFTAVRHGKWKLVRAPSGKRFRLFDLEINPEENKDLSRSYPEIVKSLKEEMSDYESLFSPSSSSGDESCPAVSYTNASWGQKAWQPWCGQ